MIKPPRKKIAVVPIFDSTETKGGIIKAQSFNYTREKKIFEIVEKYTNKKLDEAEDKEEAWKLIQKWARRGVQAKYRLSKVLLEDQPLDSGERCDQGIVKYIGKEVHDIKIGDYVFFSGYTGTLMYIEGEGKLIILPEDFVECIFELDKYTVVPGLFFIDNEGMHFPATYEVAMNLIAESFTILKKTIDVRPKEPKLEDYNVR